MTDRLYEQSVKDGHFRNHDSDEDIDGGHCTAPAMAKVVHSLSRQLKSGKVFSNASSRCEKPRSVGKGTRKAYRENLVNKSAKEELQKLMGEYDALRETVRMLREECGVKNNNESRPSCVVKAPTVNWVQVLENRLFYHTKLTHDWKPVEDGSMEGNMRNFNHAGSNLFYNDPQLWKYCYTTTHTGLWNKVCKREALVSIELYYHVISSLGVFSSFSDESLMNMIRARISSAGCIDISRYDPRIFDDTAKMIYCYLRSSISKDNEMLFQWPGQHCPAQLNSDTELKRRNVKLFPVESLTQKLKLKTPTLKTMILLSVGVWAWYSMGPLIHKLIPRILRLFIIASRSVSRGSLHLSAMI